MPNELLACEKWLKQTLLANADIEGRVGQGVYADIMPEGSAFPCVLFSRQDAKDTVGGYAQRLMSGLVYHVRAVVDAEHMEALGPLANAIDAALQATPDTPPTLVDGVFVRGAFREEPVIGSGEDSGLVYTHAGGFYRITTYAEP